MKLMKGNKSEGEHSPSWCEIKTTAECGDSINLAKTKNFLSNAEYKQFLDLQEELKFCEAKKEKINEKVKETNENVLGKIVAFSTLYSAVGIGASYMANVVQDFAPLIVVPAFVLGVASTGIMEKLMKHHYNKQAKLYDEKSKVLKEQEGALYYKKLNEVIAKSNCDYAFSNYEK